MDKPAQPKFPLYPDITVRLIGEDGNAFFVLGKVQRALKNAKVPEAEVKKFMDEATAGDYNHLLRTVMQWVEVE